MTEHWSDTLVPALIQHIYIVGIAVACGLVISLAAALVGYRFNWFEKGFVAFSTVWYTIPSVAFFFLFVPLTGITLLTVELALTGYTFLLLFRNAITGLRSVPPEAVAAATGMGMTPTQILLKVNLRLALPSIVAGLRVASATAIALGALAAFVVPIGLGSPIRDALNTIFKTELIAGGGLAILLALASDILFVALGEAITPWARAARKAAIA